MTLEEATKILTRHLDYPFEVNTTKLVKATKLGIEALKHFQQGREADTWSTRKILPGETEN